VERKYPLAMAGVRPHRSQPPDDQIKDPAGLTSDAFGGPRGACRLCMTCGAGAVVRWRWENAVTCDLRHRKKNTALDTGRKVLGAVSPRGFISRRTNGDFVVLF